MATHAVPEGFHTVTPFLMVEDADKLVDFLKSAFGAQQKDILYDKEGRVWHAQLQVGDSMIMVADSMGKHPSQPGSLYLYLDDADAAYEQALAAGAESVVPPKNQFYGDRAAGVRDPSGNIWWVATHIEDVGHVELEERARELNC